MASDKSVKRSSKFIVDNAYEVVAPVGRGRNSVVYKARCLPAAPVSSFIKTFVALKMLVGPERAVLIRRTKREANAMLASAHPNVVKLIDYVAREDACYIAMEYIDRSDLKSILDSQQLPMATDLALRLTSQLLSGLERVHRSGIIHRDIKPENLLLTNEYLLKITDFGIAFIPNEVVAKEDANQGIGTFDYLAPETLEDGISNVCTDLYSVATTCYQLLTKNLPYGGMTFTEQITNKLEGISVPLSNYATEAPLMLEALLRKGFAPDPTQRFQTAREFREAIEAYREGRWQADPEALPPHTRSVYPPSEDSEFSFEGVNDLELEQDFKKQHDQAAPGITTDDLVAVDLDSVDGIEVDGVLFAKERRFPVLRFAVLGIVAGLLFNWWWNTGPPRVPLDRELLSTGQERAESVEIDVPGVGTNVGKDFTSILRGTHQGVFYGLLADEDDVAFAVAPAMNEVGVFIAVGIEDAPVIQIDRAQLEAKRRVSVQINELRITLTVAPGFRGEGLQGTYLEHNSGRSGFWEIW